MSCLHGVEKSVWHMNTQICGFTYIIFVAGLPVIPVAIPVGVQTFDYGVDDQDGNLIL